MYVFLFISRDSSFIPNIFLYNHHDSRYSFYLLYTRILHVKNMVYTCSMRVVYMVKFWNPYPIRPNRNRHQTSGGKATI